LTRPAWDYSRFSEPAAYGGTITYERGLGWLAETCDTIEDWGAGTAFGRRYVPEGHYLAIDGSPSPFADRVIDLTGYLSSPDGIFMRHVLEHNQDWRVILGNACASFRKRFALVIFTPFGDRTGPLVPGPELDLSFRREDLTWFFSGLAWEDEEFLGTGSQYGDEHVFYVERK